MTKEEFDTLKVKGQFTVTMRERLIEQEKEERQAIFTFIFTLSSILVIIAGFGFTAFQFIKIKPAFFLGEFLVMGALFYLGYKTKQWLVNSASETSNKIYDLEVEASEIKEVMLKNDEVKAKEIGKVFLDKVSDTKANPRIIPAKIIDAPLTNAFWVAMVGIIFILLSFVISLPARDASWRHQNFYKYNQMGLDQPRS